MSVEVEAGLVLDDGEGGERDLSVNDFKVARTGAATEATQADVLTQVTAAATALASALTQLQAIATNTSSTTVDVAELNLTADQVQLNTDAVETKLDTVHADLVSIVAKILAAPSTEAKQDTANTALTAILAAVDGLEGLLGRLPSAGASSEATLVQVRDYLDTVETKLQALITGPVLVDNSPAAYAVLTRDSDDNPLTWTENGHSYTATYDTAGNLDTVTRTA